MKFSPFSLECITHESTHNNNEIIWFVYNNQYFPITGGF